MLIPSKIQKCCDLMTFFFSFFRICYSEESLPVAASQAYCVRYLRWCALCLCEKEFGVVTFIAACHTEARGAFLLSWGLFPNGLVCQETCNIKLVSLKHPSGFCTYILC